MSKELPSLKSGDQLEGCSQLRIAIEMIRYETVSECCCYGCGHLLFFGEDEADPQNCAQASILAASVILFSCDNSSGFCAPDLNDRISDLSLGLVLISSSSSKLVQTLQSSTVLDWEELSEWPEFQASK